jgi:predicted transcriptional regulator
MTLSDVQSVLTIRLDDDLDNLLEKVCARSGRNRSDVVRDALRRQLAVTAFDQLRSLTMPFAEAKGFLTDEDVFGAIS